MRQVLPDACVSIDTTDELSISLPDPDDYHVLAAARASGAEVIVISNLADFPAHALGADIAATTPDALFLRLAALDEDAFLEAVANVRARLRSPPINPVSYAAGLARAGCPGIADWLRTRSQRF